MSQKPSGSRTPLTRERVLSAAVEVADERGVGAVTMREVASRLGVEAMSLYNHVANKDALLDGMLDHVIEEVELPSDSADWRDAMRRRAVSAREVFERHPWAPLLIDSRQTSGPSRLRYYDWVLGTLMGAGFSVEGASRAFSVLDSYVYGFGIQQSNTMSAGDASPEEMAAAIMTIIPPEEYPHLHRMASHAMQSGYDPEADFAFGLDIVLGGLERVLEVERESAPIDLGDVRAALRALLLAAGHEVASDTMSRGGDLYLVGERDLARAVFVFGDDAEELAHALYMSSGSWVEGMPPRFAVLPRSQSQNPAIEMLEQMRAVPVFFEAREGRVDFGDLDRLLAEGLSD